MTALDQLPQRIETLAEKWNVPGVAVIVDVAGTTHSAFHGITHIDHSLPIDEHILFQVASNTKPFAATLVMALIEEGRLVEPIIGQASGVSWQPPPEEPLRLVLCHPHHAMIEEPEAIAGALVDFDPAPQPQCAWLRVGGRIAVRESL